MTFLQKIIPLLIMLPISMPVSLAASVEGRESCTQLSHFDATNIHAGDAFQISRKFVGGLELRAGKDFFYFQNGKLIDPRDAKPKEASCVIHLRSVLDTSKTLPLDSKVTITSVRDNEGESHSYETSSDPLIRDFECFGGFQPDGVPIPLRSAQFKRIFHDKIDVIRCK